MCTISWLIKPKGYCVFFNRDEQITRPRAVPPAVFAGNEVRFIMPVDPQGGGAWFAVNELGLTFALLNYYQGRLPKGRLISRGQIVKQCSDFVDSSQVKAHVDSLNLARYAPFSLLVFAPHAAVGARITMLRWDGKSLVEHIPMCPLISSAMRYDEVHESRLKVYDQLIGGKGDGDVCVSDFVRLHSSHLPERSALSVCMHRHDAQTVSFSQVEVTEEVVRYLYSDGAPCENPLREFARLQRSKPPQ